MWLFYIFAGLLTAAAATKVLMPLMGRRTYYDLPHYEGPDKRLATYRDQLAELERARALGEVSAEVAEEERLETERRMVELLDDPHEGGAIRWESRKSDRRLGYALTVLIPLAALLAYLPLGRPDMQGQALVFKDPGQIGATRYIMLSEKPLRTLLTKNPNDMNAVMQLGVLNQRLGRYGEAVKFYRRAVELSVGNMKHRSIAAILGEAQVLANNGVVGMDAIETFEYVKTLHEGDPKARFYLALALAQNGEKEKALAEWRDLLNDAHAQVYWSDMVREQIAETASELRAERRAKQ